MSFSHKHATDTMSLFVTQNPFLKKKTATLDPRKNCLIPVTTEFLSDRIKDNYFQTYSNLKVREFKK